MILVKQRSRSAMHLATASYKGTWKKAPGADLKSNGRKRQTQQPMLDDPVSLGA